MLGIYFALAWEIRLIPFNRSPSGCSKDTGIWGIAVMNCFLGVQRRSAEQAPGEIQPFSEKKRYLLRLTLGARTGHTP